MTSLLILSPFSELSNLRAGSVNLDYLTCNYSETFYGDYALSCSDGCWQAMDANHITVGFCLAKMEAGRDKLFRAHVGCLTVAPHCRGTTVASALMCSCADAAETAGGHLVDLWVRSSNTRAIRFYEKLNFHRSGINKQYYDDGEDAYEMARFFGGLTLEEYCQKEAARGVRLTRRINISSLK